MLWQPQDVAQPPLLVNFCVHTALPYVFVNGYGTYFG